MDGTITTANKNFQSVMGYNLKKVKGKHHSMFAEPAFAASDEYEEFWAALDRDGTPFKVVKFAADITRQSEEAVK